MAYVLVHQKVNDYAKWKPVFDEHAPVRKDQATSKGGYVFQSADDPNEVIVLLEVADTDKARAFTQSDELREIMQKAGVTSQPHIHILELADRPSA